MFRDQDPLLGTQPNMYLSLPLMGTFGSVTKWAVLVQVAHSRGPQGAPWDDQQHLWCPGVNMNGQTTQEDNDRRATNTPGYNDKHFWSENSYLFTACYCYRTVDSHVFHHLLWVHQCCIQLNRPRFHIEEKNRRSLYFIIQYLLCVPFLFGWWCADFSIYVAWLKKGMGNTALEVWL